MGILTKLFGSHDGTNGSAENALKENEPKKEFTPINRHLFIEDKPPAELERNPLLVRQETTKTKAQKLTEFADSNLSGKGFDAGYKFHNSDMRKAAIRQIRSEFQSLCKLEAERLRDALGKLKTEAAMLDLDDMMETSKIALNSRITEFKAAILRLQEEILLAEDSLGMIKKPVESYCEGFTRGYQLYLQEDVLNQQYGLS